MAQKSRKHHYIPKFYTKRWVGADGKLCEYSKPYREVITRRKSPDAVGFEENLYLLPNVIPENQTLLEDRLFRAVDQFASDATDYMLMNWTTRLDSRLRSGFTRLLVSFFHRTPKRKSELISGYLEVIEPHLAELKQEMESGTIRPGLEGVTFAETAEDWRADIRGRQWGQILANAINSQLVGGTIINMVWVLKRLPNTTHTLLCSDSPLIHSNGIKPPAGNVALPLGPRVLFIGAHSHDAIANILSVSDRELVSKANDQIVRKADRFVYGVDAGQLSFVERRLRAQVGTQR